MYLFTLEHSKTAYQTDAVLYSVAVVALASLLLLAGPRGPWLKFGSVPGRATDFDLR